MARLESNHGEQSGPPYEWGVARVGDERVIARGTPEGLVELYRVKDTSIYPRAAVRVDAVVWRGNVVEPLWNPDYKTVDFQHSHAGRMDSHPIDEPFDEAVFLLDRIHVATHLLDFPDSSNASNSEGNNGL